MPLSISALPSIPMAATSWSSAGMARRKRNALMSSPMDLPLSEIAARLADGRLRARELTEAAQARHDPRLNAYKTWAPEFALRQADAADAAFAARNCLGQLQGIPVSVKDLYGVAGLPVFAGSPRELPAAWQREGPLV